MVAPTPPYGQFYADITDSTVQVGGNPVSVGTLLTSGEYAFQIGPATLAWKPLNGVRSLQVIMRLGIWLPQVEPSIPRTRIVLVSLSLYQSRVKLLQAATTSFLNFLVNGNLIGSSNQTQAISGAYMSGNFMSHWRYLRSSVDKWIC